MLRMSPDQFLPIVYSHTRTRRIEEEATRRLRVCWAAKDRARMHGVMSGRIRAEHHDHSKTTMLTTRLTMMMAMIPAVSKQDLVIENRLIHLGQQVPEAVAVAAWRPIETPIETRRSLIPSRNQDLSSLFGKSL